MGGVRSATRLLRGRRWNSSLLVRGLYGDQDGGDDTGITQKYVMRSLNEISWGNKTYYPSPTQVSNRMSRPPGSSEPPTGMGEEGLEFPGERYEPPFTFQDLTEIVARASGKPWDNVIRRLREMDKEFNRMGVRVISLVADSHEDSGDMKYSFHITFQGFTGYYSWTDQWIGFDAEGQDVYGQGLTNLIQLQSDPEDWD